MIIEYADTEEKFNECINYLSTKKIFPIKGTCLFYAKMNDNVMACAGWNADTGCTIDPFITEEPLFAITLFNFMKGVIIAKGYKHIQVFCNNEKVNLRLIEREGFRVWNEKITGLILEL